MFVGMFPVYRGVCVARPDGQPHTLPADSGDDRPASADEEEV